MKFSTTERVIALQTLIPRHRGVFTIHDLENFFLTHDTVEIQMKLKSLLKLKILERFCRGFYVAQGFDIECLSQRICPHSVISLGSVLAKEMVIGSIPKKTVYAVKVGKSRIYKSQLGQIVHLGFASVCEAERMWFGYEISSNGIRYANKEKAFLDTLYFYLKGRKFSFNVYSDIQVDRLDAKLVTSYLGHYQNPKFKKFVEGVLHGQHTIK